MNNITNTAHKAPGEYFDETTFKTLYGGALVTWITTSVIVDIFGLTNPKLLGIIIALLIAFIGFYLSDNRTMKKLVVTPFNGFLIYFTIIGGTSFFPPPEIKAERETAQTEQGIEIADDATQRTGLTLTRQWNYDRDLHKQKQELVAERQVIRQRIEQMDLTQEQRQDIIPLLQRQ